MPGCQLGELLWRWRPCGGGGGLSEEPREVGNGVLGTGVGVLESSHQGVGHCSHISPQKGQAGAWAASKPGNTRIFGERGEVKVGEAKEGEEPTEDPELVWACYGEGLLPPEAPDRQPWGQMDSLTSAQLPGSLVRPLGPRDAPGHWSEAARGPPAAPGSGGQLSDVPSHPHGVQRLSPRVRPRWGLWGSARAGVMPLGMWKGYPKDSQSGAVPVSPPVRTSQRP